VHSHLPGLSHQRSEARMASESENRRVEIMTFLMGLNAREKHVVLSYLHSI
jgi:hypothetical protein